MGKKILIIEDEEDLCFILQHRLEIENYEVKISTDGDAGLKLALSEKFDLILLDIMLPKLTGLQVCSKLRQKSVFTPIIMLTAKSQLEDKTTGLKTGADDYITKPFEMDELLTRIEVRLRDRDSYHRLSENIKIDLDKGVIYNNDKELILLAQEIKLLKYFYEHVGEIVLRVDLLKSVWGYETNKVNTRTVDVHIARLRQKLGDIGDSPKYISTIRGRGYKFIAP